MKQRAAAILLTVMMVFSACSVPAFAKEAGEEEDNYATVSAEPIVNSAEEETDPEETVLEVSDENPAPEGFSDAVSDRPATLRATAGGTVGTITWSVSGSVLTFSGSGKMKDYSSPPPWYDYRSSVKSIVVKSGITYLGMYVFCDFSNVTSVSLPSSLTGIGYSPFYNMTSLTSVTIPDSVTSVGDYTFYKCSGLKSVTLGNGIKATGYGMFGYCSALTTVNFGSKIKELGGQTFAYCTSLKSITLPSTIKTLGNGCFGECTNLTTFVSKGIKGYIPFQTFFDCSSLTSVTLNEGVTKIYRAAFYGCKSLTSITLPASMEFVHFVAFPSTTKVTNKNKNIRSYYGTGYRIENDVKISGKYNYKMAFQVLNLVNKKRKAKGLSSLVMDQSLLTTAMKRGTEIAVMFSHTRPDGSLCFYANSAMVAENIAAGQRSASAVMDSWMNSEGHKANILGEDYTTIGIGCFYHNGTYYWVQCFGKGTSTKNCKQPSNKKVTNTIALAVDELDDPIDSAGVYYGDSQEYEFKYSMSLNSPIKRGNKTKAKVYVQNAGDNYLKAHIKNSGLTFTSSKKNVASVSKKGVVKGKGKGKTRITASLAYTKVSKNVKVRAAKVTVNGSTYQYNGAKSVELTKANAKNKTTVTIPASVTINGKKYKVTAIGKKAFANCTKLKKVTIPSGVKTIGKEAFYKCKSLKTVKIKSKKLKSVGKNAFKGIKKKAKFKVPADKKTAYKKLLSKKTGYKKTMKIK